MTKRNFTPSVVMLRGCFTTFFPGGTESREGFTFIEFQMLALYIGFVNIIFFTKLVIKRLLSVLLVP